MNSVVKEQGELSGRVIGACIEVHRNLGPGLLESAYHACLAQELRLRGVAFEHERDVPLHYKGVDIGHGYRLDFVVERELIVELKAVERLLPIHEAQLLSYLRLMQLTTGLLVNFHTDVLRTGLRRLTINH
jgi:GxxExxY protein